MSSSTMPHHWAPSVTISTMPSAMSSTAKRSWQEADESRKRSRHYHSINKVLFPDDHDSLLFSGYGFSPVNQPPGPISTSMSHPRPGPWDALSWPMKSTETTASGLSLSSDTSLIDDELSLITDDSTPASSMASLSLNSGLLSDAQASQLVREHLSSRRSKTSQHERILRSLISPRCKSANFTLDDTALASIFSSANELFFAGRLTGRVAWDWSNEEAPQYQQHVIGTTAIRRRSAALGGGLETLIVLSKPILRHSGYNRHLVIFTFLHEMIHCFLFVCCGSAAKQEGGHTQGFKDIAVMMDIWAGSDSLNLRDIEANLERFRDTSIQSGSSPFPRRVVASEACLPLRCGPHHHHQEQRPAVPTSVAPVVTAHTIQPLTNPSNMFSPLLSTPFHHFTPFPNQACGDPPPSYSPNPIARPHLPPTPVPSPWSYPSPSTNSNPFSILTSPAAHIYPAPPDRSVVTNHHPRNRQHRRHPSYDRYPTGPHQPPRRPHPVTDRWDSPFLTPPSNTPITSPCPSPNVGIGIFIGRRYGARR